MGMRRLLRGGANDWAMERWGRHGGAKELRKRGGVCDSVGNGLRVVLAYGCDGVSDQKLISAVFLAHNPRADAISEAISVRSQLNPPVESGSRPKCPKAAVRL